MQNKKLWSLAIVSLMSWLNAEIEPFDLEDFERNMITQMSGSKRLSGIELASNKYGITFRGHTKGFKKKVPLLVIKRNQLLHEFTLMFGGNIIIGDGHRPIIISENNNWISWPSGSNVNLLGLDSSGHIISTSGSVGPSTELGTQGNNWVSCPVEGDVQIESTDGHNIDFNATTGNINVNSMNLHPNTNSIGIFDSAGYPLIPFTLVGIDINNNLIDSKKNLFLFGNIGSTSSYVVVDSRINENVGIIFKSPLINYPSNANISILGINSHGQVVTTTGAVPSTELGSQGNNWVNCPVEGDIQIQSVNTQNISFDSANNIILNAMDIDTESEWANSFVLAADTNNNLITTNMINNMHVLGNISQGNWLAVDNYLSNGSGIALITSNTNQNISLNAGSGNIYLYSDLIEMPINANINILGVNSYGQVVTTTGAGSSTELGTQGNNWVSCPVEGDIQIQSVNTQNISFDSANNIIIDSIFLNPNTNAINLLINGRRLSTMPSVLIGINTNNALIDSTASTMLFGNITETSSYIVVDGRIDQNIGIIVGGPLITYPIGSTINLLGINYNGQIVTTTGGGSSTELGSQGNNWVNCPVEGDIQVQSALGQNIFINSFEGNINLQGSLINPLENNICLAIDVDNNIQTTNQSKIYYFGDPNANFFGVDNLNNDGIGVISKFHIQMVADTDIELLANNGAIVLSASGDNTNSSIMLFSPILIPNSTGLGNSIVAINGANDIGSSNLPGLFVLGNNAQNTLSYIAVENSLTANSSIILGSPLISYPAPDQINVLGINSLGQVITVTVGEQGVKSGYFEASQEKLNKLMEIVEILQEKVARLEARFN